MTSKRPNLLRITTDQQRWDALGINAPATDLRTPVCDQLAASGVNFTRAYSTCPVCIPARRSLLTGLHPASHGLRQYKDGLEWDPPFTLPGLLSGAGWHTALIGKLHLHPQRKRYGFDHMIRTESPNDRWDTPLQPVNDWVDWMKERGFTHPNDIGINGNGRVARPWDKEERFHHTSWLADQAVEFFTRWRDPSQPFFLHLSFWAPHPPLIPPPADWDRYHRHHRRQPISSQWMPSFDRVWRGNPDDSATGPFDPSEMHDAIAGYYGLVNHIDDRIRYVISRLFEYGSPRAKEPTLILFTSDHGELLGDHGLWRKSLPYEGSAHVPFFITGRNLPVVRASCDQLVCLEDIAATVLDLCGQPIPPELQGPYDARSLAPTLRGDPQRVRDALFGECGGAHFILKGSLKYLWFAGTGEEQLFNLEVDPEEKEDLSGQAGIIDPFRRLLDEYLAHTGRAAPPDSARTPCLNGPPRAVWGNKLSTPPFSASAKAP